MRLLEGLAEFPDSGRDKIMTKIENPINRFRGLELAKVFMNKMLKDHLDMLRIVKGNKPSTEHTRIQVSNASDVLLKEIWALEDAIEEYQQNNQLGLGMGTTGSQPSSGSMSSSGAMGAGGTMPHGLGNAGGMSSSHSPQSSTNTAAEGMDTGASIGLAPGMG